MMWRTMMCMWLPPATLAASTNGRTLMLSAWDLSTIVIPPKPLMTPSTTARL